MKYFDPKITENPKFDKPQLTYMGMSSPSYKWERQSTYGGKITENIVQGGARDVMAEAMVKLDAQGYEVVLTVHDEIVSEVPQCDKRLSEKGFCDIMAEVPTWAAGLPLEVDSWRGERFRK
jgi:DNA polymerase